MTRYILIFLSLVISSAAISQEGVTHIAVSGVFTQSPESPSAGFQIKRLRSQHANRQHLTANTVPNLINIR